MALSEKDKQELLQAAFDPRRTALLCAKHKYSPGGPKMPTADCADCWMAFFMHHIASMPPNRQAEKLEELEMVLRTSAELEDKGQFDAKFYRHPKIVVEKGVA